MKLQSEPTLDTIYRHCSIRKYMDKPISESIRIAILEAGRAASSSSFMQSTHIIRVTDVKIRESLCQVASNQTYVIQAPEFWVFCIDFAKHKQIFPQAQVDWMESVIAGAVDAGIMAQNCLLAAESLGLGSVYIGSLRNHVEETARLLNLPKYTVPLFGLCVGYPAQQPLYRPRLPLNVMVSENVYNAPQESQIAKYDRELTQYYQQRSGLSFNWSKAIEKNFNAPVRPEVLPFLHKQGLATH